MVKKKSVRKKITKKRASKNSSRMIRSTKRKINLVFKNLIVFGILSIISLMLYKVSSSEFYVKLFLFSSVLLGFITLAFLIIWLTFLLLRLMKK
ncbi:MAG: hypothetical protein ABH811_02135 [archaeon]